MPIPGSILNNAIGIVSTDALYPSLCTFYRMTSAQDTTGQDLRSFAVVDAGHTNVPCRRAPLILVRSQHQENPGAVFQHTEAKFQLSLNTYFADLDQQWRVLVDGVMYEILSVESDGNHQTSRLMLGQIFPFVA